MQKLHEKFPMPPNFEDAISQIEQDQLRAGYRLVDLCRGPRVGPGVWSGLEFLGVMHRRDVLELMFRIAAGGLDRGLENCAHEVLQVDSYLRAFAVAHNDFLLGERDDSPFYFCEKSVPPGILLGQGVDATCVSRGSTLIGTREFPSRLYSA